MEWATGNYDMIYGQDLEKFVVKGTLMNWIWVERSNSNSKSAIKYKWFPNKQRLVICEFSD